MSLPIGTLVEENMSPRPRQSTWHPYSIYSYGLILGKIEGSAMSRGERIYGVRVLKVKEAASVAIRKGRTYWMVERNLVPYRSNKKCIVKFSK